MLCDSSICVTRDPKLVRSKNTPAYADCSIQLFKHLASEHFYTTMYIHMSKYHHHISNNFCYFEALLQYSSWHNQYNDVPVCFLLLVWFLQAALLFWNTNGSTKMNTSGWIEETRGLVLARHWKLSHVSHHCFNCQPGQEKLKSFMLWKTSRLSSPDN